MQGAVSPGERGYDPDRWEQGRCRSHGDGRRVEAPARGAQRATRNRHRAHVRGDGGGVPEAAPRGACRRGSHCSGARARSATPAGPSARSRYCRARPRRCGGSIHRCRHGHRMTASSVATRPTESAPRGPRLVRAPRGTALSCKGWQQEAALRMLMNNLDPDVAERPDDLVVYGGTGRAARSWEAFDAIVATLRGLEADETVLVQSGKPVAVFRTQLSAPRVLIANSNLVGRWATWEKFRELERLGLTMYGQMTAGSWIYIGSQGILQGTYETFGAVARGHFGGTLAGRFVLTAGLGGMGGAQPLAATMQGAAILAIEVDEARIDKRLETKYLDRKTADLDEALKWIDEARSKGAALSVGLLGNAADVIPALVSRGITPDVLTDQTSAHDMLNGYIPSGMPLNEALALRTADPKRYVDLSTSSAVVHVEAMLELRKRGAITFDYGNNIRTVAFDAGLENAFDIPGFVPEYVRPLFCEGKGPVSYTHLRAHET